MNLKDMMIKFNGWFESWCMRTFHLKLYLEIRREQNQEGVTPIDSIVTAATALSQWSNHPNRCSQWSKWSQKDSLSIQIPVWNGPRLQVL